MFKLIANLAMLVMVTGAFAAGKIQNEDVKSLSEITGAGGTAAQLINDSKIYVTGGGINQQLSAAITAGLIGGSGGSGINMIATNPNFENVLSGSDWLSSGGTFARVTAGSNLLFGNGSVTFTASATSQYFQSALYAVPNGLAGANCIGRIYYKGGDANLKFQVVDNSANVYAEQVLATQTVPGPVNINFVCPAAATQLRLKVISTAAAALIAVDNTKLGDADNLSQVSQYKLIGSAYFAPTASCTWQRANSSYGAFSTNASCPGPTIEVNNGPGVIQTTDVDLPTVTVNSLPAGTYVVLAYITAGVNSTSNNSYLISDGTTNASVHGEGNTSGGNSSAVALSGIFTYTNQGNRSFSIYAASGATAQIFNEGTGRQTAFQIYQIPTGNALAMTPSLQTFIWAGYHNNTCDAWTLTASTYGNFTSDASCALVETQNLNAGTVTSSAGLLPGIVFTPNSVGMYEVCATFSASLSGSAQSWNARLYNLTDSLSMSEVVNTTAAANYRNSPTLCGYVNAASLASKEIRIQALADAGTLTIATGAGTTNQNVVSWTLKKLTQSIPAPVILGLPRSATINNNGTTCDIESQGEGTWITATNRVSSGVCDLTVVGFSSKPRCSTAPDDAGNAVGARISDANTNSTNIRAVTAIVVSPGTTTAGDYRFTLMCQ